jgi:hypothetical protein
MPIDRVNLLVNTNVADDKGKASDGLKRWFNDVMTGINEGITPIKTLSVVAAKSLVHVKVKNILIRVISGTAGNVQSAINPQIAAGFDGQIITYLGTDNVRTVTIAELNGVELLDISAVLKNGDSITLMFDAVRSIWRELYRSIK